MGSVIRLLSAMMIPTLLFGCVTVEVESKVAKNGVIEDYRLVINTTPAVYSLLAQSAREKGYSSLREALLSNVGEEFRNRVSYDEIWSENRVSIVIEGREFVPKGGINISREGNFLLYRDYTFENFSGITLHYYLRMPGEIVESNANVVKGDRAEWHIPVTSGTAIYARSEIPATPGFDAVFGFLTMAFLILLTPRRRRRCSANQPPSA